MNETQFIRARRPEQKAQRAQDILVAARLVLDRDGIEAVTLAAIAKEAGVVKSNLYRYFESREEILFRLMIVESEALVADGAERLSALAGTDDIAAVARALGAVFVAHPRFCLLISQMAPILERNISVENLIGMKREVLALILKISEAISEAVPSLGTEGAMRGLHMVVHYIAGLWPMANPSEAVARALEEPDLAFMRQHFGQAAVEAVEVILEGIRAKPDQIEPI